VAHGDIDHQIVLAHKVSTHNVEVCPAMAITPAKRRLPTEVDWRELDLTETFAHTHCCPVPPHLQRLLA
jgi:hypothetical protein